jgi:hypothetical protein
MHFDLLQILVEVFSLDISKNPSEVELRCLFLNHACNILVESLSRVFCYHE